VVDAFLAEHESFPVVDGEWVHFLYRGDAEDLAIVGSLVGDGSEGLERLPGTDLFHYSARLEPGTRWEYRFVKNLEENLTDPMNPRTVPAGRGTEYSELVLPGYESPDHLGKVGEGGGTVETLAFRSEGAENDREIKVYLPPGYGDGEKTYPLLLVHDPEWIDKGLLVNTLDHLVGRSVEPVVVAFVAPVSQWWTEGGGTSTIPYSRMLVEELVPFLESKYRLEKKAASRAVFGAEGFGLTAAYVALAHPEVFGKAGAYSVHLGAGSIDPLMELVEGPRREGVEFFVAWNRWDVRRPAGGYDLQGDSQRLMKALEGRGYEVSGGEQKDSFGWGSARAVGDELLEALFPLE
jgi:enterochelin esterase family protein